MNLKEVDLRNIYKLWQSNLGAFRCFFRSTAFVSLKTYEDFTILECDNELNSHIVDTVLDSYSDDYFTIVDLNLDEILDLALILNNENNIKPVLNVNLLFNKYGLIGNKHNISKLINNGLNLKNYKANKYVMMIPYDRYDESIDVSKVYDKLNNQYAISDADLPDKEFLKALGYKGLTIITKNKVKEDLNDYIELINKNVEVNIVRVE